MHVSSTRCRGVVTIEYDSGSANNLARDTVELNEAVMIDIIGSAKGREEVEGVDV